MTRYPKGMRRLTKREEEDFWNGAFLELQPTEPTGAPFWFRLLFFALAIGALLIIYALVPPAEPQGHAPLLVNGYERSLP
jgi:hypothetical protein